MGDTTKIQWADATFNPWIGCTKVSPGCVHCYAERETRPRVLRARGQETWGKGKPRVRTGESTWGQVRRWNRKQWRRCPGCGWTGSTDCQGCGALWSEMLTARMRVFPSMCDPFDAEVPVEWLADYLRLIFETPNIDHLLLTKRPEKVMERLREVTMHQQSPKMLEERNEFLAWLLAWIGRAPGWGGPVAPENVWVGTSVEDQVRADERIPVLLKIPAKVRFLSVEPLLGEVKLLSGQLGDYRNPDGSGSWFSAVPGKVYHPGIHWVIVGGESGPKARPCAVEWIRSLVQRCKVMRVPVFVKQLGSYVQDRNDRGYEGECPAEWPMGTETKDDVPYPNRFQGDPVRVMLKHRKGGDPEEWPEDLRVREWPVVEVGTGPVPVPAD
jgi:protein gp37